MDDPAASLPSENGNTSEGGADRLHPFHDVPVRLTVAVGQVKAPIGTLLSLDRNVVLTLDRTVDDPVVLYAGERIIAYGELQDASDPDGRLVVRITELASSGGQE